MDQEKLRSVAKNYWNRRDYPQTALGLWSHGWRHMAIEYPLYLLLVAWLWWNGYFYAATGVFWFWIGRAIRDYQWCRAIVKDGKAANELMDWERIRQLAESEPATKP